MQSNIYFNYCEAIIEILLTEGGSRPARTRNAIGMQLQIISAMHCNCKIIIKRKLKFIIKQL